MYGAYDQHDRNSPNRKAVQMQSTSPELRPSSVSASCITCFVRTTSCSLLPLRAVVSAVRHEDST